MRVDVQANSAQDLMAAGINVGDWVAFDLQIEISPNGYINSRYLDDKAAVAALLCALQGAGRCRPRNCRADVHPLFTITEEVGSGSSAALHGDIVEMVSLDATAAPGQNTSEHEATICMRHMSGPFDFHLTHKLIDLAQAHGIPHRRDVFRFVIQIPPRRWRRATTSVPR